MAVVNQGSVAAAILWMLFFSICLFWLPFVGPVIAGFVGSKKSGGLGPPMIAVFLPIIVLGIALFLLASSLAGLPIISMLAGAGAAVCGF